MLPDDEDPCETLRIGVEEGSARFRKDFTVFHKSQPIISNSCSQLEPGKQLFIFHGISQKCLVSQRTHILICWLVVRVSCFSRFIVVTYSCVGILHFRQAVLRHFHLNKYILVISNEKTRLRELAKTCENFQKGLT